MFHFVGHHFAYFVVAAASGMLGYFSGCTIKATVLRDYEAVKARLAAIEKAL